MWGTCGLRFLGAIGEGGLEIGTARARPAGGLRRAPALDGGVVSALEHVGNAPSAPYRRTGVVGVVERAALERLALRGLLVAEHARDQAHDGLGDAQRRELAAREHEVAERDLVPRERVAQALVEALVAAAQEEQALLTGEDPGRGLAEGRAVRGQQDLLVGAVLALAPLDAVRDRFGLQHHARAAAVGPVVYRAVAVAGEIPEIDRPDPDAPLPLGLTQDARSQVRLERLGEEGEEGDLH